MADIPVKGEKALFIHKLPQGLSGWAFLKSGIRRPPILQKPRGVDERQKITKTLDNKTKTRYP
jgi:hypothetical protein